MPAPLPTAWFNGSFLPLAEVRVSPLDRGFLFGDAVYEVIPVYGRQPFLLEPHLDRLERSLAELRIANPLGRAAWREVVHGLVARNGATDAAVYLQVSRGADSSRDHCFPGAAVPPTTFGMVSPVAPPAATPGIRAITRPDERWGRCDIKATALLANVLARQAAEEAGAGEALLLRDGELTEGSASTVLIVEGGALVRRPDGRAILPGTTADAVFAVARRLGIDCRVERIPERRLRAADEIWVTAAMRGVAPVVELDGRPVGTGTPGPVWRQVAAAFEATRTAAP